MKFLILPILVIAASCSSTKKVEHEIPSKAKAVMNSSKSPKIEGDIVFEDNKDEIKVITMIRGLKPNTKLGFHIHEKSLCEAPDYKSAGGHLNPHEHQHGQPNDGKTHLGDMGNIKSNKAGVAKMEMFIPKEQRDDMNMILGKAVIIHAHADDMITQPTGNSGDRIACGLIRPVAE